MSVYAPEAPADEAFAAWETDEASDEASDELAEARRERRWTRPQVARASTFPRPGGTPQRPSGGAGPITQSQLDSSIALLEARIAAQIKTNSDAIKRLDAHVETVNAERRSLATNAKKEDSSIRRELQQTRETILLLTLLTPRPQSVPFDQLQDTDKVVVDRGTDSFSSILPLFLLMSPGGFGGGYGGGSANGSSGGGGMDQSGLLFAALLLGRR
jgi:hypothetical protein